VSPVLLELGEKSREKPVNASGSDLDKTCQSVRSGDTFSWTHECSSGSSSPFIHAAGHEAVIQGFLSGYDASSLSVMNTKDVQPFVMRWLRTETQPVAGRRLGVTEAVEHFNTWTMHRMDIPILWVSPALFGRAMRSIGVIQQRTSRQRYYPDIELV
jgi:hypothetical protein